MEDNNGRIQNRGRSASKMDYQTTIQDEATPLLPSDQTQPQPKRRFRTAKSAKSILGIMLVVIGLASCADQIKESPETRIFESIICYRYYEANDPSKIKLGRDVIGPGAIGGVDELLCKADEVQDELAMLLGYQSFFDGFPLLLLALPFGWAADRYGRWPFLFLNLLQFSARAMWSLLVTWYWQAFDIRAIWAGSVLSILGGGSAIATSLLFVVISDITKPEDRAENFLRAGAANLSASLFMPPLAAALMHFNPWIPSFLGAGFLIVATMIYCLAPETMDFDKDPETSSPEEDGRPPPDLATTQTPIPANFASRWYRAIKSSTSFLAKDWRIPALIATFLVHILLATGRLLLQYVSKRYALTFSKATLLVTIRNGVNVVLLFTILPYMTKVVMRRYGWNSQQKDLYLARASWVWTGVGWLCVAASPNIPTVAVGLIFASLGEGRALLTRSFLTSLLENHQIATTYSIISVVDTLGLTFGAPFLAELFKQGLALGGAWVGLPFFVMGLLATLLAGLLFVVRLRKGEGSRSDIEEEE